MNFREMMKRMSFCAVMAMLLSVAQPASAGSVKDVLELVPDDAWGFFVASSLDRVDQTAAKIKDSLGLPIPSPLTPLALEPLRLGEAVDMSSPVCAVMLDVQKMGGPDQAAVLLVPAKDPKQVLENLSAQEETEGVSKVTVMGEPGFAAIRGKTVILGPNKDAVVRVAKGNKSMASKASEARIKTIGQSDAYLSFSVGAILTAYKDMYVMPMLQMVMAATDPEGRSAKQLVKMFEEMTSFDIGLTFDDKGLSVVCLMTPKADSDLEKYIADEKGTEDSLLASLPKDKYLFSMGVTFNHSEHSKKFGGDKPISETLKMMSLPIDAKLLEKLDTHFSSLQKNLKRAAISVSALPEGSDGMIALTIVGQASDSEKFVEDFRKMYASIQEVSDDEDFKTVTKNIQYKNAAETIAGSKVDTIEVMIEEIAEATEGRKEEVEQVRKVLGSNVVLRIGAVGDNHVVFSLGGGKKRFETVAQAAKSSGGLSNDAGIAEMSRTMPSRKLAEIYVAVDTILQTVKSVSKALGEDDEIPFDVPTINAPVAMSSAVQDTASRLDLIIPMKLIKAGKEAFDKYSASAADDFDDEPAADSEEKMSEEEDSGDAENKAGDTDSEEEEDGPKPEDQEDE